MKLEILRYETGDYGTFSTAVPDVDPDHHWDMIELPWRENQEGCSCVLEGTFIGSLVESPRFKRRVYLLRDIPGRKEIEMHPANWAGDRRMGYYSQLLGCCAPGKARGAMQPPGMTKPQPCVLRSADALDEIIAMANGEDIEFTFKWVYGILPE